jgi:iduronate 2-sulfatase
MAESSRQPNVLFLICHDIGRRYGSYGNAQIVTPHIDALAQDAVQFDQHFCQWPLCGPSRATIFSGCRPPTTERYNNQPFFPHFRQKMGPAFGTLPELFKAHGYRSLAAGLVYHDVPDPPSWSEPKWDPPPAADAPEWAQGWLAAEHVNMWLAAESRALMRQRLEHLQAQGCTPQDFRDRALIRKARGPAVEGPDVADDAYYDGQVTQKALECLEQVDASRPFFLAVGFVAAHTPFRAPKRYWDLYNRTQLRLPENLHVPANTPEWAEGDSEPAQYYTQHGYERPWRASREASLELLHGRYAAISYIDAQVGKLLAALQRRGLDQETIVVLTSDHGFHDGEHGYWGKHNLWDVSLQVPLLVRLPASEAGGTRIQALTEHVDLYPTLCDLGGLPKPAFLEGDSMLPLLDRPERLWKPAVFAHRKPMWHDRLQVYAFANTVRTATQRFTVYLDAQGQELFTELFDYEHDPLETMNVAADPRYADVCREMRQILNAGWQYCRPEALA